MIINEKTFKRIYNDYFEVICRFLNHYTHDLHAIEEVVQEVFVKLWIDFQGKEIGYIKTYLYNSARNRMLNYLRDSGNRHLLLEKWARIELEDKGSVDCINRDEFLLLLQTAVDTLPTSCKEIYMMSREKQLTYKKIAQIRGISVKTVENQMGIALKKIREYILLHAESLTALLLVVRLFPDNNQGI
jgi:RNA polymerase sigma-70 factor (ECF subfamily)